MEAAPAKDGFGIDMHFRYALPEHLIKRSESFKEFANGAMQVTVKLRSGTEVKHVLLSDARYIVAARGYSDLPFAINDIADIYQDPDDEHPANRAGWYFWDRWD